LGQLARWWRFGEGRASKSSVSFEVVLQIGIHGSCPAVTRISRKCNRGDGLNLKSDIQDRVTREFRKTVDFIAGREVKSRFLPSTNGFNNGFVKYQIVSTKEHRIPPKHSREVEDSRCGVMAEGKE
jgi:hypothetical protein